MIQVTIQFDSIGEAHAVLGTLMASGMPTTVVADVTQPEPKPKAKRKAKAKPKVEEEITPAPPPTSKEAAAESDPLQVLRLALAEYSKEHGIKHAIALLKDFEIKRLPDLPEDRYEDFSAALAIAPDAE